MKKDFKNLEDYLRAHKVKPSYQRLKVLEYLLNNPIHPSVDKIYLDLRDIIPTLSKTTVYNTIKILERAGLVKTITILENESRYDGNVKSHGHFMCLKCNNIFDFNIDIDSFKIDDLNGFDTKEKDVYFKGLCPTCQNKIKEEQPMKKYICSVCGYVYDPSKGDEDNGIAPNTPWEQLPEDWVCPICGVGKDLFNEE